MNQKRHDRQRIFDGIVRYLYGLGTDDSPSYWRCYIYPSGRCNDRCVYCGEYRKGERYSGTELFGDIAQVDKLVGDIRGLGIREVHLLGGGEPFFYKDAMMRFLRQLRDDNVFIKVLTNGINLTGADAGEIVRDGLLSEIAFNVNSDTPELGAKLYRSPRRHEHTLELLESFRGHKRAYGRSYPLINAFFVLTSLNYDRVDSIVRMIREYDVSCFFIQPMRVYEAEHEWLRLTPAQQEQFERSLPELEALLAEAGIASNTGDFRVNSRFIEDTGNLRCVIPSRTLAARRTSLACYLPLVSFSVYADGTIAPCMYLDKTYSANYFEIPSMRELVRGAEAKDFRLRFVGNTQVPCDECPACVLNEVEEIKRAMARLREEEGG